MIDQTSERMSKGTGMRERGSRWGGDEREKDGVNDRRDEHRVGPEALHGARPEALPGGRFLTAAECQTLITRLTGLAQGGGRTTLALESHWTGNLRWARNRITGAGDVRDNNLELTRDVRSATGVSRTNTLDDRRLVLTLQRAERMEGMIKQNPTAVLPPPPFIEPYPEPKLWFESTYQQTAAERAELMQRLVQPAEAQGLQTAGYVEVSAAGRSTMAGDVLWYYPYTTAQYSVTVRTPDGSGSGWAGVDHNDWSKIDAVQLTQRALEKCLQSKNPVRLEPGRYLTILEPQAVGDLVSWLFTRKALGRARAELGDPMPVMDDPSYGTLPSPFAKGDGKSAYSRLGELVIDARLSVRTDCTDPMTGFPPFGGPGDPGGPWQVYHPVTWVQDGVLKELAYYRPYAVRKLGLNSGGYPQWGTGNEPVWWRPGSQKRSKHETGAFHMTVRGATVSVDEMIQTTKRGLLVTRFVEIEPVDEASQALMVTGYTRDGLWLIEDGKLSKPVKNFRFTDSPVFALNNVEQLGVPQRIFNPKYPIVVPALKVRDFSFTALSDAV